jgi:hypothetical protein
MLIAFDQFAVGSEGDAQRSVESTAQPRQARSDEFLDDVTHTY